MGCTDDGPSFDGPALDHYRSPDRERPLLHEGEPIPCGACGKPIAENGDCGCDVPVPYYELRPDDEMGMDEIVAGFGPAGGFHMEALGEDSYWFGLTFANGQMLTWTVYRKGKGLHCTVVERPGGVEDRSGCDREPER